MAEAASTRLARRAPPRRRQAGAGAGDHAGREPRPGGRPAGRRALPAHRQGADRRLHRPARGRQEHPDRRALPRELREAEREVGVLSIDPSSPFTQRRRCSATASGSPSTSSTRGLHPLDGHPRRARRPRRGRAAGGAADGRLRQGRRPARDRRRRPGRDRHRRPRRHGRARADAGLGRLDPGAQGRGDGDPRRDRRQQGRSPAGRHDDPRGQGGARARPEPGRGRCRSSGPRRRRARGSPSWSRRSTSTARSSTRRARSTKRRARNLRTEVLGIATARMRRELEAADRRATPSGRRCSSGWSGASSIRRAPRGSC